MSDIYLPPPPPRLVIENAQIDVGSRMRQGNFSITFKVMRIHGVLWNPESNKRKAEYLESPQFFSFHDIRWFPTRG